MKKVILVFIAVFLAVVTLFADGAFVGIAANTNQTDVATVNRTVSGTNSFVTCTAPFGTNASVSAFTTDLGDSFLTGTLDANLSTSSSIQCRRVCDAAGGSTTVSFDNDLNHVGDHNFIMEMSGLNLSSCEAATSVEVTAPDASSDTHDDDITTTGPAFLVAYYVTHRDATHTGTGDVRENSTSAGSSFEYFVVTRRVSGAGTYTFSFSTNPNGGAFYGMIIMAFAEAAGGPTFIPINNPVKGGGVWYLQ